MFINRLLYVFTILIISFLALFFFNDSSLNFLKKNLPKEFKLYIKNKVFNDELDFFILNNYKKILYNQHFLPKTQFEDLDFQVVKLDFVKDHYQEYQKTFIKKFFIENVNNDLFVNYSNNFYVFKSFDLKKNKKISTNLNEFNFVDFLGVSKVNDYLILSVVEKKLNSKCGNLKILYAEISYSFLKFDNFYTFDEKCLKSIVGGRVEKYNFKSDDGFLITTGAYGEENLSIPQDESNYYGKIIFFDLNKRKPIIFSKGHRNPQGLFVGKNVILSTEHGDYGGDEINNIIYGQNYGYPISSYGEKYKFKKRILKERKNFDFLKSHMINNFNEPVFSFVPSIGISQIIKVPNTFSKYWNDNYLVASLNSRSLYRVKFDSDYKKIYIMKKFL